MSSKNCQHSATEEDDISLYNCAKKYDMIVKQVESVYKASTLRLIINKHKFFVAFSNLSPVNMLILLLVLYALQFDEFVGIINNSTTLPKSKKVRYIMPGCTNIAYTSTQSVDI